MRLAVDLTLVLALLAVVPVGLHRIDARLRTGAARGCGLAGCAALLCDPGWFAGALAGPWLMLAAYSAWAGARRFSRRSGFSLSDACFDAAPAFLAVGAAWFVADRIGLRPLGFAPPLTALTAAHFHYAGFAAACIAGWTGRSLRTAWAQLPGAGVLLGTPLVAMGIALSPALEITAALGLAASMSLLGGALLLLARRQRYQRRWLRISGASPLVAMALAAVYAAGNYSGEFALSLQFMAWTHGLLSALGFAGCGMLAFRGERP